MSRFILPFTILLLAQPGILSGDEMKEFDPRSKEPNPAAIEALAAGEIDTANAAWWGFDPEDSTRALRDAVNSGAKTVVVPFMGQPWIIRPITLGSNITLLFEPGVVVQAKRGEFKGRNDSLFRADDQANITLRGYGARLVMWKEDYQSDRYEKAEWRMGISFRGCSKVTVEGLRIEKTGGDGIYIGATKGQPFCRDVTIRDVECVDNHRQGVSVISAENLLIENCLFAETDGTAPQAGIDLEPNGSDERLVDCVIRNCLADDNTGAGILVYLGGMSSDSERPAPVSILFEDCLVLGGKSDGVHVAGIRDGGPDGEIEFRNCTIENTGRAGIAVNGKSADRAALRFVNCNLKNVFTSGADPNCPIYLGVGGSDKIAVSGGITFDNCYLWDTLERPPVFVHAYRTDHTLRGVTGEISEANPVEVPVIDWKVKLEDVSLAVVPMTEN